MLNIIAFPPLYEVERGIKGVSSEDQKEGKQIRTH
jgi:hypothetical protein